MSEEKKKPKDLGDPEAAKERNENIRKERERELNDLRAVLALPAGQRLLERLVFHCGIQRDPFDASARVYRNAGVQSVGHFLVDEIIAADDVAGGIVLVKAYKRKKGLTE